MKLSLTARALVAVAMGAIAVIAPADAGALDNGKSSAVAERGLAEFEGRTIDLKEGWGVARACHVDENLDVTCYRSEAQMDKALGLSATDRGGAPSEAHGFASCSSSLRLYWNSYYSGPVLYLTTRQSWITLSWFGFNNVTSSYKVGACSSLFRSGNHGTGSTYPGGTWAWAQRSTMGYGWDNVLSSVYIY